MVDSSISETTSSSFISIAKKYLIDKNKEINPNYAKNHPRRDNQNNSSSKSQNIVFHQGYQNFLTQHLTASTDKSKSSHMTIEQEINIYETIPVNASTNFSAF